MYFSLFCGCLEVSKYNKRMQKKNDCKSLVKNAFVVTKLSRISNPAERTICRSLRKDILFARARENSFPGCKGV